MKRFTFLLVIFTGILFFHSCDKDKTTDPITGDALFTYVADGYHVTFTNESTVSGTYDWDFGDGASSTEKNPEHTYSAKGDYTVKLTVTDSQSKKHSIETKVSVNKSTPVKLDDNSFDDWSSISEAFTIGDDAGSIKSFKVDYDGDNIYFYIKQEKDFVDASIFDMLIDVDPDTPTGYTYGLWPKFGGAELLIENSFSNDRENGDLYWLSFANYDPNGSDWDTFWIYDEDTPDTQVDGTYKVAAPTVEIEFSISRKNIPVLKDVEKIKIVAWTSNQDWDEIGWMPDKATEANPDTDGIIIDMK